MTVSTDTGEQPTGAQAIAGVIAAQERPVVLGMPGGYAQYIYDALYSHTARVQVRLVRQESLATVMAEAQGRLTGRPAFVVAQGAWVLGNGGIGVMEAQLGASPMVLLIDATDGGSYAHLGPYQGGIGSYGAYDLAAAMRAIAKRVFVATDPTQALQMTQLAVKHAVTGEPGPVAVIFSARSLRGRIGGRGEPRSYPARSYDRVPVAVSSPASIAAAAAAIRDAARPVIVAGNGIRLAKAEAQLAAFAHRFDIPVATSPAGKGVFGEDDALAVGVIGSFGHAAANRTVGEADLIVALGTKLGATDTAMANPALVDLSRQRMVQIDVEPLNVAWTFPADVCVHGDAADALPRIAEAIGERRGDGAARVAAARAGTEYFSRPFRHDDEPLSARDVVRTLSETVPPTAVVTCDAGENRLFVLRDFQSRHGGTVLQPNGGGGMGYAVPAAMAAAMTFPDRPAVAVCGDGGIAMSLHGLISAVELGLKLTVLVLDNGVLGWVHSGQGDRKIASRLASFDYAAIAGAIGCRTSSIERLDAVAPALHEALAFEGVSLVHAKVSTADRYQDIMAKIGAPDIYAVGREPSNASMGEQS